MKYSLYLLIPAGVALAFFVMQYLTATEQGSGVMTREEIATELTVEPFDDLFDILAEHFPERHKAHMKQVADVMNDTTLPQARKGQQAMALNRDFIEKTRRDFAGHVGQASETRLLDIQRAAVALLEAVQDDPELCTRVALAGPGALDRSELVRIDRAIIEQVVTAYFRAIVEGREDPVHRDKPGEADWQNFIKDWVVVDENARDAIRAFMGGQTETPRAFCDGAISFRRELLEDGSPAGLRMMAEFSQTVASR